MKSGRPYPQPNHGKTPIVEKMRIAAGEDGSAATPSAVTLEIPFSADLQGRLIDISSAGLNLFGYERADLERGLSLGQIVADADRAALGKHLQALVDGSFSGFRVFRAQNRRGGEVPIAFFCYGEEFDEGCPTRLSGLIVDLRPLPELSQKMVHIQRHQKVIARMASCGIYFVDLGRRIRSWNRAAAEITGLPASAVIGKTCQHALGCRNPEGQCPITHQFMAMPIVNKPFIFNINGKELHILKNIDFVRNGAGKVVGAVECFIDLTRQHEAETALREAEHLVRSAQQAKNEFMANMTHEIRTPMNGIMGVLDLLLTGTHPSQNTEYLQLARQAAANLMKLVNDILNFSVMERGPVEFESSGFSLRRLVASAIDHHRKRVAPSGPRLESQIEADVPDSLIGDAGRLYQILDCFLGNAVKFTEEGHIALRVENAGRPADHPPPRTTADKAVFLFRIEDTGIGIPKDRQEHIFKAFTQGDGSFTRTFGGVGLGLHIAWRLIQLLGGQVWVESEEGRGATFSFHLPIKVAALSELQNQSEKLPPSIGPAAQRPNDSMPPEFTKSTVNDLNACLAGLDFCLRQGAPNAENQILRLKKRVAEGADKPTADALFKILLTVRNGDIRKALTLLAELRAAVDPPRKPGEQFPAKDEKGEAT